MIEFHAEDPWPSPSWWNERLALAGRGTLRSLGDGLERQGQGLGRHLVPEIWAKIGGVAPAYSFQEATPGPSGGFDLVAGGRTDVGGRQPAYEANGVTLLAGTYQRLRFSTVNDWRFQEIRQAMGAGTGTVADISGCYCQDIPSPLTMTSGSETCNYDMFQSCTLAWQTTPSWAVPLNLGPEIFLSTQSFPDPIAGGALFYYFLTCQYNQFNLTRLYPISPYGSPFRDAVLYTWLVGGYGNTCSPFHLDNGSAFPGSDLSCSVTIDGPLE